MDRLLIIDDYISTIEFIKRIKIGGINITELCIKNIPITVDICRAIHTYLPNLLHWDIRNIVNIRDFDMNYLSSSQKPVNIIAMGKEENINYNFPSIINNELNIYINKVESPEYNFLCGFRHIKDQNILGNLNDCIEYYRNGINFYDYCHPHYKLVEIRYVSGCGPNHLVAFIDDE